MTDDHSNPSCPIKLAHGTTTLAFRFQGGIVRIPLDGTSLLDFELVLMDRPSE